MLLARLPFVVVEMCDAAAGGAKQCALQCKLTARVFCVFVFAHGVVCVFGGHDSYRPTHLTKGH